MSATLFLSSIGVDGVVAAFLENVGCGRDVILVFVSNVNCKASGNLRSQLYKAM